MSVERYRTLGTDSEGLYREKASKFIAYAFPVAHEDAFAERCALIAKEHHTCRHVCYAWVLGESGERYRANDAGEPAGTAGKPLLRHLQGSHLTFAAIVVVRYFGGTLLGKGGLVHAYGEAAREALHANRIEEHVMMSLLRITCGYALVEALKTSLAKSDGSVTSAVYGERCELIAELPRSDADAFVAKWTATGATVSIAQR
jgi:uncharacterized YigZ family protein